MVNNRPYVIGVAGGSGSGKTTVVQKIVESAGDGNAVVVQHDWYYRSQPHLELEDRARLNYDHPDALETSLLIGHLKDLIAEKTVTAPVYDFSLHERKQENQEVIPRKIIIVDGILIFRDEELRKLMDMKVFVDTDSDLRFIRRMERDIRERARTRESVVEQYLKTVKPMHDLFVETSKRYADIIIPRGGENSVGVNLLIAKVESILNHGTNEKTTLNTATWGAGDGYVVNHSF